LYRVTAKGGVVVWIVGDATIKGSETGTSFKQALWAIECGFRLNDTMIWNKGGFAAPGYINHRYPQVFEYMFVFSKDAPNGLNIIRDRKNKKKAGVKIFRKKRLPDGSFEFRNKEVLTKEFGVRFNVWSLPPEMSNKRRLHPAPFPEHIAIDHIISWSNKSETVLDPFMGSGTTGVACVKTGRKFIGIELDQGYFDIAKERIYKAISQSQEL
jgi:DNA modification methylase